MPQTIQERIKTARDGGFSDVQIFNTLLNSNVGNRLEAAKEKRYTETQILNTLAGVENPRLTPPKEKEGFFKSFFKPEIGAVDTIISPFFSKKAQTEIERFGKATTEMAQLYKNLPEGKQKERIRGILEKEIDEPELRFEKIIPAARKTTSQALGEAISLGLLVTPFGFGKKIGQKAIQKEIQVLSKTGIVKRVMKNYLKGGTIMGAFSGAYGLAEEGELEDKIPTIAAMSGIGFLGGGVISGFMPPMVKGGFGLLKNVYRKIYPKIEEKIVAPTIRYIERPVGKVKTIKAIHPVGLSPLEKDIQQRELRVLRLDIEKAITETNKDISKLEEKIPIPPEKVIIPKELQPLAQEARKIEGKELQKGLQESGTLKVGDDVEITSDLFGIQEGKVTAYSRATRTQKFETGEVKIGGKVVKGAEVKEVPIEGRVVIELKDGSKQTIKSEDITRIAVRGIPEKGIMPQELQPLAQKEFIIEPPRTYKGVQYTRIRSKASEADFAIDKNNDGWITNLFTKEEFRNKGEATELVKRGLIFLKEKGVNSVKAIPENTTSRRVFDKFGFERLTAGEITLTKRKLTDFYTQTVKGVKPAVVGIPKELEPLAQEARKFEGFEKVYHYTLPENVANIKRQGFRVGTYFSKSPAELRRGKDVILEVYVPKKSLTTTGTGQLKSTKIIPFQVSPKIPVQAVRGIPAELQPLAQEARKYKSAEELLPDNLKDIPIKNVKVYGSSITGKPYRDIDVALLVDEKIATTKGITAGERIFKKGKIEYHLFADNPAGRRGFFEETKGIELKTSLTDFYTQAVKGVEEVLPIEVVSAETLKLQKEIDKLKTKRQKLLNKSLIGDLKAGDEIFNMEIGRIRVRGLQTDLKGKFSVIGEDVNGRIVTVMPEDVVRMKKIIPQNLVERTEIIGLPEILEQPIKLGKFQEAMFGVKGFIQTTSNMVGGLGKSGKAFVGLMDTTMNTIKRKIGLRHVSMRRVILKHGLNKKKTALTREETKNIIDILDAGIKYRARTIDAIPIKPINQRVRDFVETFAKTALEINDESSKMGIWIRDIGGTKKHRISEPFIHLPHIPKDVNKLREAAPEIVQKMMERDATLTPKRAYTILNRFIKNFGVRRYSGLEKSRTLLIEGFDELDKFGYETNPIVIFNDFVGGATKRLEEAKFFGKENEIISNLINRIGIDGYDKGLAQSVWNTYTGERALSATARGTAQRIRTWQVVGKLPLAAIVNSTQIVNVAAEFGITRFFKTFRIYMADRIGAEEAGLLAGVRDEMMTDAMRMAGAESKVAGTFLKKVGFTAVERFNRIFSVVGAQKWADDVLKTLIKNPDNPQIIRHLNRLGISNVRKAIDRGRWAQEELNTIGQKAVQSTQFRGSVLDIPLFWSSEWGKVLTQFKSFAWQQGAFVKREIVDEAIRGNYAPFITYLIMSEMTGEAVRDVRDVLKGDFDFRQDESILARLIENQFSVGGFGLAGDLFYNMFERATGKVYITAADFIGGPTMGEMADFVDGIADALGGRFTIITGFATRDAALLSLLPKVKDVPGAGVYLRILGDIIRTISRKTD